MIPYKMSVSLLLAIMLAVIFVAADHAGNPVTFRINILDTDIHVGDTFSIQVLLDAPAGPPSSAVKDVAFTLTPNHGVTILSAVSGGLLSTATSTAIITPNRVEDNGGYSYGELTTGIAASGTNLLFVTLTTRADTAGTTTFSFSNLRAQQGGYHRTASSTTTTITILPSLGPCSGDFGCPILGARRCIPSLSTAYQECTNNNGVCLWWQDVGCHAGQVCQDLNGEVNCISPALVVIRDARGESCIATAPNCAAGLDCVEGTCRDVDDVLAQIGAIIRNEDGNYPALLQKISGIAGVLRTFFA